MSKNANCLGCDYYYKPISGSVTIEGFVSLETEKRVI